jgi:biopolymer transport protein ExbB/TolQ
MPVWIVAVQWMSRSILGMLLLLSIWSVATMIQCARTMRAASGTAEFEDELKKIGGWLEKKQWDELKQWASVQASLHAGTAQAILGTSLKDPGQVDRVVRSYLSLERTRLEKGLTVLATLGSNAPFIGLFGTVLGIIQAFGALGAQQNQAADIMVGISEALIATAVGLFVAIPAVVGFNFFSRRLRVLLVNSEALKDLVLAKAWSHGGGEDRNGR